MTIEIARPRKLPPGIVERHGRSCPSRDGGRCGKPCTPRFEAWVYSVREGKKIYKTFPTISAAKGWRSDATTAVRKGTMAAPTKQTVEQAGRDWIAKARAGEILKPDGKRYKPSVLRTYDGDLERYVYPPLGSMRLSGLHRRDVQQLVDRLVGLGLSGSKVRNAVMPLRAICRRAIRNDEIVVNPTANLELPEAAGTRDRVASPTEAFALLELLPEDDQALWATAIPEAMQKLLLATT